MKFKGCKLTLRKRRGLSSIVGALLFVVLMVATFAVLGVALNSQTDIVSTGRDVAETGLKKQQEEFIINSIIQQPGETLAVQMTNKGQNPAEIFTLIITNSSDIANGFPTNAYEIPSDTSFLAPGDDDPTDVVETLDLKIKPVASGTDLYDFKLVSSLGTIEKFKIECVDISGEAVCGAGIDPSGTGGLVTQLFLDGPNGVNTKNSTIVMFVTNTGDVSLTDVAPDIACVSMWSIQPLGGLGDFTPCVLDPLTIATLVPGQTALFLFDGVVAGDVDDIFTFCNSASGEDPDTVTISSNLSCDAMTVIDPNDCGGCDSGGDDDILDEKFITRPELFLTIPSPFGHGTPDTRALWGANVVNPTDTPMEISKVTITAFPPASQENFDVVGEGGSKGVSCLPQDIHPGRGIIPGFDDPPNISKEEMEAGSWSCPGSNTIMWRNYTHPITLPPQSTVPFMVRLQGDNPISGNAESVLVDSTVYTTSGSFGKGNYQSTAYSDGMYANIFQVTDPLPADPLDPDNWISSLSDIPSGSEQTFHMVLTDFDDDLTTHINATTKVIVNVPRAFTLVDTVLGDTTGFNEVDNGSPELNEPSITIHPDDTTQIIATLTADLGDDVDEYAVLSFKATAPIIATGDNSKLMVMYTLANGLGTNDNSVGPLTEIILVVLPEP